MIEGGLRLRGVGRSPVGDHPLVSVITVVRNGVDSIGRTIEAVLSQSYPSIEYIIIDGASTDGTLDVIRGFDDRIGYWRSEPDAGLYDAMNKGIELVTNPDSYVMFANSGDRLLSPESVQQLVKEGQGADFVYGRELRTDGDASAVAGHEVSLNDLASDNISHAASLTRRRVFDTVGRFDLRYRIVADYDFFVRCFSHPVSTRFVDRVIAEVGMFGLSETSFFLHARERIDVICRRFGGTSRTAAVARIYCIDIPRHFLRGQLRRFGLLRFWRAIKAM